MARPILVLVSLAALLAGFYLSATLIPETPDKNQSLSSVSPANSKLVGSQLPTYELLSNTGESVTNTDFAGNTVLINFWATWCLPCREEMPMLMELHEAFSERGFRVLGIALDDTQQVNRFIEEYGISYPILVGEADVMATSAAFGNMTGVLPYSVLVDKLGIIRWQYAGEISHDEISDLLKKLL